VRAAALVEAARSMSFADEIEQALPALGALGRIRRPPCRLLFGAPLWQIAHRPEELTDAYAEEPKVPVDWNPDFASALTRLLTATCVGLLSESTERNHT
jgi:hypothetical protein